MTRYPAPRRLAQQGIRSSAVVVDCALTRRPSEDRQGVHQSTPLRQREFKDTNLRCPIQPCMTAPAASMHPYRTSSFWTDDARTAST
ncbi:hypothetical protein PIIN_10751 [Serendipita indica DSM 11827]|uniref:Uncharacterized protein n=1 Tax=Serendipita indica (strain DSM 11827) TaxID=1109443 RepID=G4TZM1_SERID|nr:hypothetical protein PIIN_10751 [Serendipita indica DSM 11827]